MTDNIYEQTLNCWARLIEPFFPKDTRFETMDTKNSFCIYIQPPKYKEVNSRISYRRIILTFTDEAIDEYIHSYEPGSHRKADIRLKDFVASKLKTRKRERDLLQENALTEYWLITTDTLNR
jgi:hypothetical protein